jgi:hypothetical protein
MNYYRKTKKTIPINFQVLLHWEMDVIIKGKSAVLHVK